MNNLSTQRHSLTFCFPAEIQQAFSKILTCSIVDLASVATNWKLRGVSNQEVPGCIGWFETLSWLSQ
jgi:hypothetical protein